MVLAALAIVTASIADFGQALGAETWHGLVIAPEHRCAPYDRGDYRYSQSVEAEIVATMGGRIYGPYTGRHYSTTRQTISSTSSLFPRLMTVGSAPPAPIFGGASPPTCST